jgi:hypothetical protein
MREPVSLQVSVTGLVLHLKGRREKDKKVSTQKRPRVARSQPGWKTKEWLKVEEWMLMIIRKEKSESSFFPSCLKKKKNHISILHRQGRILKDCPSETPWSPRSGPTSTTRKVRTCWSLMSESHNVEGFGDWKALPLSSVAFELGRMHRESSALCWYGSGEPRREGDGDEELEGDFKDGDASMRESSCGLWLRIGRRGRLSSLAGRESDCGNGVAFDIATGGGRLGLGDVLSAGNAVPS